MIRAAQWHRVVEEAGERDGARRLSQRAALTKQPLSGTYELSVGATQDHEARAARLSVRCARVTFRRPKRRTKDQRALGLEELTPRVVETRAVAAPQGLTPRHRLHGTRVWWTSLRACDFFAPGLVPGV